MRSWEFVVEQETWDRIKTPTQQQQFDQWAQEKRGRAALTTVPAPKQTPGYALGATSPFADSTPQRKPTEPKYNQDLYRSAPADEYQTAAPQSWGGRAPKYNDETGLEKYNIAVPDSDYKSVINPEKQKQQKLTPLNLPGGTKEKYRT